MINKFKVISGDMVTPISIYKKLCRDNYGCLLESVEKGQRYSFIGRNPFGRIRCKDNCTKVEINNELTLHYENPFEVIRKVVKKYGSEKSSDVLPDFYGGALGYVGYDMIKYAEKLPSDNEDNINMPDMDLFLFSEIIAFDHLKKTITIIVNMEEKENQEEINEKLNNRLNQIVRQIESNDNFENENKQKSIRDQANDENIEFRSNETKESFMEKVEKAKEYIENGDIFQVVLSQRMEAITHIDPFEVYRKLRVINPSPYMFYINFKEYQVVGASPEMLVKKKDTRLYNCPIAGTRKRGSSVIEDEKLVKELVEDEKEKAEHNMLVDLGRNDIGHISKNASVEVTKYMKVEKFSHVMHLVSMVEGNIQDDKDMIDAYKCCMPAGTVSGAPKIRAMEIINELEGQKRGIYSGAVGYFGFDGNMDTCIAIRTAVFKDSKVYVQAGAGIVKDSVPENEHEETLNKLKGMIEAIKEGGKQ